MNAPKHSLWHESPYQALRAIAQEFPTHDCLQVLPETARIYDIPSGAISYREQFERVEHLRRWYERANLGAGDRVGLMLENRPQFHSHWFALNALGVSVVPLNVDWRSAELEYVLAHSEVAIVIALDSRRDVIASAAAAAGRERLQVVALSEAPDGTQAEANAAALRPLRETAPAPARPVSQCECALLYTSGTTGRPKGCILSNEYYVWAGQWYVSLEDLVTVRRGAERMLSPLPLTHMNAMAVSSMCMLLAGGCLILLDRFHPSSWWSSVHESGATIVHYLGVMPAMLLGATATDEDRNHAVRFGFGAGVNPAQHAPFEQRFGFPLIEAWAMTETGSGAVVIANHEPRHVGQACFGRPGSEVQTRIIDEGGADADPGAPGELLVRHAGEDPRFGFFTGYLKDKTATDHAWQDGWFHTGDVVRQDADGLMYFIDRRKNVIRRSGENISAVEVETVLVQHPKIAAVGVTAVPDAVRGDEVFACIVVRDAAPTRELADEIVRFALARLAYYKPPGYVQFCADLPRTATQKVQRAALRAAALEALHAGLAHDLTALKKRDASTA
ncbi:MAG: AMP-binding protein [Steroidobacteraceae bacterium]